MCATFPAHLIQPDLMVLMLSGEEHT
jgi:hypothetical protein